MAAADRGGARATSPVVVSFAEGFRRDATSTPVTAVGMRWTPPSDQTPPTRVLVLVDTSASQMGDYRRRSREALVGLLEAARPSDRFLPAAADVACVPLAEVFAAAGAPGIQQAIGGLDARTPLGSTDLIEVLDRATALLGAEELAGGTRGRAIVYIGDGPGLGGID
ncbi:MAG: hypothetical protein EBX36_08475, partial [Planctomycetia bacterium]|nr:hypothetical protein [Planctomycetia bacterium]